MNHLRFLNVFIIVGISLSAIGCFLPWVRLDFFPFSSGLFEIRTGSQTMLGSICLALSIFAAFFQVLFLVRNVVYAVILSFISGLVVVLLSGAWILNKGLFEVTGAHHSVLYGVYVTLLGVVFASASSALLLFLSMKR